jgi:hypothetical protein
VDELVQVRQQLGKMLGKPFVIESDSDYSTLNKVVCINYILIFHQVAEKIDIKIPEEGEVIKRLMELAKERNIAYEPSHEAKCSLNDYCVRKGINVICRGSK